MTRLDSSDYVQSITKNLNLHKMFFKAVERCTVFKTLVLYFVIVYTESVLLLHL